MFSGYSLKDTYIFESLIGAGGMGEVWSAKRTKLGDRVAIKVLKLNSVQDKEAVREQLKKEAKVTSILNHPNICKVYDFIEQDDVCFLVMELLEGHDLQVILANPKTLYGIDRLKLANYIGKQVLRALDSAHNINHPTISKILHRDIKPANIFLTKHGEVKLLDLGVAKIETDLSNTKTSNSFYSLQYTCPDLWENGIYNIGKYSEKNDIYSLGLVFYEILTGEKAFMGTGKALYEELENGAIPSISRVSNSFEVISIFEKWTNPSSQKRYQNVNDLLLELEKIHISYSKDDLEIKSIFNHSENKQYIGANRTVNEASEKSKSTSPRKKIYIISFFLLLLAASFYILLRFRSVELKKEIVKEPVTVKTNIKTITPILEVSNSSKNTLGNNVRRGESNKKIKNLPHNATQEESHFHFKLNSPLIKDIVFKLGNESSQAIQKKLSCSGKDAKNVITCSGFSSLEMKNEGDFMIKVSIMNDEVFEIVLTIMNKEIADIFVDKIINSKKFKTGLNYQYNKSWLSLNEQIEMYWLPKELQVDYEKLGYHFRIKKVSR